MLLRLKEKGFLLMFLFLLQGVVESVLWKPIIFPEHVVKENYAEKSL